MRDVRSRLLKLKSDLSESDPSEGDAGDCFFCEEKGSEDFCKECLTTQNRKVYFCSDIHRDYHIQKTSSQDKEEMIRLCTPYVIEYKKGVGRYLRASRDINPGDLIFTEPPLVLGPLHETKPVCLSCGSNEVDGSFDCEGCGLPLCGPSCAEDKNSLHKETECKIFSSNPRPSISNFQEPHPLYQCILPLRCLLLKNRAEDWNIIRIMMDHIEDRPKDLYWEANQKNIVQYLLGTQKLNETFSPEEINHVIGVLDVNAFEAAGGRGLYPLMALMSHSCVSNTKYIIRKRDSVVECRATVKILSGEELTDHYVSPLLGTRTRRSHLKDGWFFYCRCRRCEDPTELGTHMSSFLCNCCEEGYVLDYGNEWRCYMCKKTPDYSPNLIAETLACKIETAVGEEALESALKECENLRLSPTHYAAIAAKRYLIHNHTESQNYGLKRERCRDVLKVTDVVTPGTTKERGLTLYELTLLNLSEIKRESNPEISKLDEIARDLKTVISCLAFEDENSFQSEVRGKAESHLKKLNEAITLLKLMRRE